MNASNQLTPETTGTIYGDRLPELFAVAELMMGHVEDIRRKLEAEYGMDPVEHCLYRIKQDSSMREKCRRKGLPETTESALSDVIHDAIGLRVVCPFVNDVYRIAEELAALPDCEMVSQKDYIRHCKPSGYRSLHVIFKVTYRPDGATASVDGAAASPPQVYYTEFQLRTISMDTWASLEHHLRYKKQIKNEALIGAELKRCADELESTDLSMQTIRDLILEDM